MKILYFILVSMIIQLDIVVYNIELKTYTYSLVIEYLTYDDIIDVYDLDELLLYTSKGFKIRFDKNSIDRILDRIINFYAEKIQT